MSGLNYHTLGLAVGLVCLFSVFVFGTLWRINREIPGLVFWFWAAALIGVATVTSFFLTNVYGRNPVSVVLNNAAYLGGLLLILEGVLRFQGMGRSRRRWPWLVALGTLALVMSLANRENAVQRYLFFDAMASILAVLIGTALVWRVKGRALLIHGVAAAGFAVLALGLVRRWLLAWQAEPGADLGQHPWMFIVFLGVFIQAVLWVNTMSLAVNHRIQQRLHHMAMRDELTQLPNRRAFGDALRQAEARARRTHSSFGVVLIDLDGFKAVNDRHGHDVGDALLQAVADRVQGVLRGGDVVCRLGGDEFVAVLEDCPDDEHLGHAADRLRAAIEAPLALAGGALPALTLQPRASLGSALFPADARDVDALLRMADQRMYQSKTATGRPHVAIAA